MMMKLEAITMEETIILLLAIVPLLFLFFHRFVKLISSSKQLPLPPGPYPWPIIGNLLQIGKKPHSRLAELAQIHGSLMSLHLGHRILIVGSSPLAASEILRTHDQALSGRDVSRLLLEKKPTVHNMNLTFTTECSDEWRNLRSIYRSELFSTKALASCAEMRERKVAEMMKFLGSKTGEDIVIKDVMFVTATNMIGNATLSMDLLDFEGNGIGVGIMDTIRRLTILAGKPQLADLYPIFSRWDLQGWYKQVMHIINQELGAIWQDIIQRKRNHGNIISRNSKDFMDVLIEKGFNNQQINPVMEELLAAGTETTSLITEWLIAELLKNQEVMQKVRDEVFRYIEGKQVKESDLTHLPFLEACLKETLRLHPPGPLLLPRRAAKTCEVMGYTIPKDSQVLVNVWAIGRDPNIWDDPLRFKPERFMGSNSSNKVKDFGYLPFGFGRRVCPGEAMAFKTILLTVASLILNFSWFLPENQDPKEINMDEELYIAMHKKEPLHVILKLNEGFKN